MFWILSTEKFHLYFLQILHKIDKMGYMWRQVKDSNLLENMNLLSIIYWPELFFYITQSWISFSIVYVYFQSYTLGKHSSALKSYQALFIMIEGYQFLMENQGLGRSEHKLRIVIENKYSCWNWERIFLCSLHI